MSRIRIPSPEEMTPEQRRVYDGAIAGKRGHVPLPLVAWLHSPEFGDRAQKLGEFVRYSTSLGPELSELAILVTARTWTAHYEWAVHRDAALGAGLSPTVIDDIAHCREPRFEEPAQQAVYEFAMALHQFHQVPDAVYQRAYGLLGEQGVVELVGILGYYAMVAMTLNCFQIGSPELEPCPPSSAE